MHGSRVGRFSRDEVQHWFIRNRIEFRDQVWAARKTERPAPGQVAVTSTAKKILRPQNEQEALQGLREAATKAPEISAVYSHYRGDNLPDDPFLDNALSDQFGIPKDKLPEFKTIFLETLTKAKLLEERDGRKRVLDATGEFGTDGTGSENLKRLEKSVTVSATDTCFVMMPFAGPLGLLPHFTPQ